MNWNDGPLLEGLFLERLHRFGAKVRVRGKVEYCHVTNSGRLRELLRPGARVALVDHGRRKDGRKTRYSIRLALWKGSWVCIEANVAPRLLQEAWVRGAIPSLAPYDKLTPEVHWGRHTRFDFLAENSRTGERAWVEVKCSTLVEGGTAYFPDAPSERAAKHLEELTALARRAKTRCFVFFVLQNPRGKALKPRDDTDPVFGQKLRKASRSGVTVKAFLARVHGKGARLSGEVPVLL